MMGSRFVRPETAILHISNGDTLIVRRRLTHGEQRAAYARMYLADAGGTMRVNPLETGFAMVVAYLLDWSLTDDEGKLVVIRDQPIDVVTAALDALDSDDFKEIKEAIEAHERAVNKQREQEKKLRAGANGSEAISSSPSAVTGPSSTSEPLTQTSTSN